MSGNRRYRQPLGIDDRSGLVAPLSSLKKEWTGFKVGSEDYDTKHPQLRRRKIGTDNYKLNEPRPDTYVEAAQINLYTNGTYPLVMSAWIGDVTVEIV